MVDSVADGAEMVDSVDDGALCPEDSLEVDSSVATEAASPLGGRMRFSTGTAASSSARTDAHSIAERMQCAWSQNSLAIC